MGFTTLDVAKASKVVPDAPGALDVKYGKAHGKADVAVEGKGRLGSFAAQGALDPPGPANPWFGLPGTGKQRKLAYPTGTRLWVQFAQVRYGLQSAWSAPVLVILP
jgi:hypothetical protein